MTSSTKSLYAGHRFPPELISYTVWLYYRFPLSLRMVEEMLAFRGIEVSHETIRQWGLKFGREFANIIRRRLPRPGDKWHADEVVLKIAGKTHYLWRAVDQHGVPPEVGMLPAQGLLPAASDRLYARPQARPCPYTDLLACTSGATNALASRMARELTCFETQMIR
jgi:putative transposase